MTASVSPSWRGLYLKTGFVVPALTVVLGAGYFALKLMVPVPFPVQMGMFLATVVMTGWCARIVVVGLRRLRRAKPWQDLAEQWTERANLVDQAVLVAYRAARENDLDISPESDFGKYQSWLIKMRELALNNTLAASRVGQKLLRGEDAGIPGATMVPPPPPLLS